MGTKIIILLLFISSIGYGQCPTVSRTVRTQGATSPGEIYRPSTASWQPGDTIKITPTSLSLMEIYGGGGTPCHPIVIVANTDLVVTQIRFKGGAHDYKLISTGTEDTLSAKNIHVRTVSLDGCSHIQCYYLDMDGQNIYDNAFYAHYPVDPSNTNSWHPNAPQVKNVIWGCFMRNYLGEAVYDGLTLENGYTVASPYTGNDTVIVGNRNDSAIIAYNTTRHTGWDGIQLSHAGYGNLIHHNTVLDFGHRDIDGQRAGIILGGDTNGDVYNNTVKNGKGNGIEVFGFGTVNVYNNTIDSVGRTTESAKG